MTEMQAAIVTNFHLIIYGFVVVFCNFATTKKSHLKRDDWKFETITQKWCGIFTATAYFTALQPTLKSR